MQQIWYIEARKNEFESFCSRFPSQSKTSVIEAARYIADLADLQGEPLQSINLARWVSAEGQFITDKRAINRIFFEANKPAVLPEAQVNLTQTVQEEIIRSVNPFAKEAQRYRDKIQVARSNILDCERSLQSYWVSFHDNTAKLNECLKNASGTGVVEKVVAQLQAIHRMGFYERADLVSGRANRYGGQDGGLFLNLRTNDVVVAVRNQRLGVDSRVNFGKFEFSIPLIGDKPEKIMVLNIGNNLPRAINGAWHPHIYDYGLCLGNAATPFFASLKALNLEEVARILANILSDPNLKSSYIDIFQTAAALEGRNLDEIGEEYRRLANTGVEDEQTEEETEDQDEDQDEDYPEEDERY